MLKIAIVDDEKNTHFTLTDMSLPRIGSITH
jgi:hypothetical protein